MRLSDWTNPLNGFVKLTTDFHELFTDNKIDVDFIMIIKILSMMVKSELSRNRVLAPCSLMWSLILAVISLTGMAFLSACATPYQAAGFRGGYTDFETQPGIYYVSFKGNGYTSKETVIKYWHRHAAEICGGSDRYQIVKHDTSTTQHVAGTGYGIVTVHKSRAEGYIRCTGE